MLSITILHHTPNVLRARCQYILAPLWNSAFSVQSANLQKALRQSVFLLSYCLSLSSTEYGAHIRRFPNQCQIECQLGCHWHSFVSHSDNHRTLPAQRAAWQNNRGFHPSRTPAEESRSCAAHPISFWTLYSVPLSDAVPSENHRCAGYDTSAFWLWKCAIPPVWRIGPAPGWLMISIMSFSTRTSIGSRSSYALW